MRIFTFFVHRTPLFLSFIPLLLFSMLPALSFGQDHEPKHLIVRFQEGFNSLEKQALYEKFPGLTHQANRNDPTWELWQIPGTVRQNGRQIKSSLELALLVSQQDGISWAEPDYEFFAYDTPSDPDFSKQWGLHNAGQEGGMAGADIGATDAWDLASGGEEVVIGLIDTGLDFAHEELGPATWQNLLEDADGDGHTLEYINGSWQLDPGDLDQIDNDGNGYTDDLIGWDFVNQDNNPFDDQGHGTHVAGIMAARSHNQTGIAGIHQGARIMALKAFDHEGRGSLSTLLPALEYARQMQAQLTNNSWGGSAFSQFLYQEIDKAGQANQLFVAAAGNQGLNLGNHPIYPASLGLDNIISVGAFNRQDQVSAFSNFGQETVDLFAPGEDIFSTLPGQSYGWKTGTSMATPFVSASLSLLWGKAPNMSAYQLKDFLLSYVHSNAAYLDQCVSGGRLDLYQALSASTDLCLDWDVQTQGIDIRSLAEKGTFIWAATDEGLLKLNKEDCSIVRYDKDNSGLPDDKLKSVVIDAGGLIWVGTEKDGLLSFDGANWTLYDKNNSGLSGDKVLYLQLDTDGLLWIGTDNKGLCSFDGTNWTVYQKESSPLPDNKIKGFVEDDQGRMWICTQKGLSVFDGTNWFVYDKNNSALPDEKLMAITQDSLGAIWVATDKGLAVLKANGWEIIKKENSGLPDNKVQSLGIDGDGDKWLGTKKGLAVYNDSTWVVFKKDNSSLNHDEVKALTIEKGRYAWAGSKEGLTFFMADLQAAFRLEGSTCQGETVSLVNTSQGDATYRWLLNGQEVATTTDYDLLLDTAGVYEITLAADNGLSRDVITRNITVFPLPQADMGPDTTLCAEAYSWEAGPDTWQYRWYQLNGSLVDSGRLITVRQSGTYVLEAFDLCGSMDRDTCTITLMPGCIWPGDANADGRVNIIDFLALSEADGSQGSSRLYPSLNWESQYSPDWSQRFGPGFAPGNQANLKHADCNGDGLVDLVADGAVIKHNANYPAERVSVSAPANIGLEVRSMQTQVMGQDTLFLSYEVWLDGDSASLDATSGLAFSLRYNLPVRAEPILTFDSTLWGDGTSMVIQEKVPENGPLLSADDFSMQVGLRKRGTNTYYNAPVARMGIIILVTDVADDPELLNYFTFHAVPVKPVLLDDAGKYMGVSTQLNNLNNGVKLILQDNGMALEDNPANKTLPLDPLNLQLSPNPAHSVVRTSWEPQAAGTCYITLGNYLGKSLGAWHIPANRGELELDLDHLSPGSYWIKLEYGYFQSVQKLLITR
jgi:subtilisin family serine protease